ncbi:glycosyltransferase family 4 protein [Candidatus Undinarchaeota archaeon]
MKIQMLVEKYPPALGGDGIHVQNLEKYLSKDIGTSIVTKSERETSSTERVKRVGRESSSIPGRLSFAASSVMELNKSEYDLLHAHGELCALATKYVKRKAPVVWTIHGLWKPIMKETHGPLYPIFNHYERKALKGRYDAVIAVDSYSMGMALKYGQKNVHLIPNGVNAERFVPANNKDSNIIAVGRLVEHKGFGYLMEAAKGLDTKVLIAGGGPLEGKLRSIAQPNVEFLGKVPQEELVPVYKKTGIFVLPSIWEGFPFTLLEAMSCECACIATKVGGVPDLIEDGKNGILIDVGDTKHLRESIIALLEDENYRKKLGKNARKKIKKDFSWEKITKQTEEVYRDLI